MTPRDPIEGLSAIDNRGWLVGGALRDKLLGRATGDYDVVVEGRPGPLARRLAKEVGGHAFKLSEGFTVWRVTARDRSWQLDLLPLAGRSFRDGASNVVCTSADLCTACAV